ncbi:unnamed protein product [Linum tenue]|uniref:Uncharacterized protein n=1 Tax=Linum tenue TaxID=586396 RepID=A0AAV0H1J9_9ROSI|nr:unnamed protein product [Linum tenue]CAI0378573.1 unnamed protein product [Linum tenue]
MAGKCLQGLYHLESRVCRAMLVPHTRVSPEGSLTEDGFWNFRSQMEWEDSRICSSVLPASVCTSTLCYSDWASIAQR